MEHKKYSGMLVKIAVAVFFIFAAVFSVKLMVQYNDMKYRQKQLESELSSYKEELEKIQTELDAPFDNDYVIKIAKEKLNLALPREIIYFSDLNQ